MDDRHLRSLEDDLCDRHNRLRRLIVGSEGSEAISQTSLIVEVVQVPQRTTPLQDRGRAASPLVSGKKALTTAWDRKSASYWTMRSQL